MTLLLQLLWCINIFNIMTPLSIVCCTYMNNVFATNVFFFFSIIFVILKSRSSDGLLTIEFRPRAYANFVTKIIYIMFDQRNKWMMCVCVLYRNNNYVYVPMITYTHNIIKMIVAFNGTPNFPTSLCI